MLCLGDDKRLLRASANYNNTGENYPVRLFFYPTSRNTPPLYPDTAIVLECQS